MSRNSTKYHRFINSTPLTEIIEGKTMPAIEINGNNNLDELIRLIEEADEIFREIVNRGSSKPIYKKALEIAKKNNKTLETEYILGKIDLIDKKGDNALKHFNNVIHIDSNHYKAQHYKAYVYEFIKKDNKKAIELYDKITDAIPYADSWYNKGIAYYELKDYETSNKCFNEALRIDPDFALAWNRKSISFMKMDKINEAL